MDQLCTTLEIINDLIEVNGQRIWNYQVVFKGFNGDPDLELYGVFEQIVDQGQRFQEALELQFVALAHDLPNRGYPNGTILRTWEVVKALFRSTSSLPISLVFDKGERAMLKAYQYAEKHIYGTSSQKIIAGQQRELVAFYRQYKSLYKDRQFV
ncbi:hypothetical protein [Parapedobacter indicus]|uniref:DUF2383 domain-containing protein n=1 Tax=Parapedobacter indicus TaxID=1477437 RepID=A0A1I3USC3_9SPHI|nr:hypothetical protein [Parapedobacter indicus]PPK99112.1 hypothetical protein CLV26_115145 [Parapedobacter indicus]SFJ85659.1 hypothetical protein SAMN05444682_11533 [Parapedobacter indicus]